MAKQKVAIKLQPNETLPSLSLWDRSHIMAILVILFSFLLFANSVSNNYNLDDELVTKNQRLTSKGIAAIPEIFSSPYYQDNMGYSYEYRPMVLASFAIEHEIFGDNVRVSHLLNILLYSLCCFVLLMVLREMLENYPPALCFAITLLFIAHSSHTEVVCSIKNRDEILGLLFALLAMYYSLIAAKPFEIIAYILIPLFFSMALLSKNTMIQFAIIIPLGLIFFKPVSYGKIIIISLLLTLPAVFFINVNSSFDKIKIAIVLLIINSICFLLHDIKSIFDKTSKRAFDLLSLIRTQASYKYPITSYDLAEILKGVFPERESFHIKYILTSLALGIIYFVAVYYLFSVLAIIPLIALLMLSWFGNKYISWSASSVLFICLSLNRIFFANHIPLDPIYLSYKRLFASAMVFIVFWGRRDLFFPCLISFVITISFDVTNHLGDFLVMLPLAFLVRFAWSRVAISILIPLLILSDIHQENVMTYWDKFVGLSFVVVAQFPKKIFEWCWFIIFLAIILFHFSEYHYDHEQNQASGSFIRIDMKNVSKTINKWNSQIISQTQYRPIQYVEDCVSPNDNLSLRVGTSSEILLLYLKKTILPYPLSFYYGYSFIKPQKMTEPFSLLSVVLYLLIFLVAVLLISRDPLISYGLFVYFFSIIFFANYFAQIPGMIADRYLLVPSLGWCLVLAGVLYKISNIKVDSNTIEWKKINPISKYGFSAVLLLYSILTFSRNTDWKDDLTLFRKDIRYVSESAQANNLLALHLMQHAETETVPEKKLDLTREALGYFKRARQIYPPFFNVSFDIGRVFMQLNMPDSALVSFKNTIAIDTTYPETYRIIGDIYANNRMFEEAMPYHEKLIDFFPKEYDGYSKLSYDYFMTKKYENSISVNKKALNSIPNCLQPLINIARVYIAVSKSDSATLYLDEALKIDPNNREIQGLLIQIKNK